MADYNEIVRKNVYRLLEERGESQAWLARKMGMTTPQQLNNNLKGRRGVGRIISDLCIALDVDLEELFRLESDPDEQRLLTLYREITTLDPSMKKYIYDFLTFQLQEAVRQSKLKSPAGNDLGK